MNKALHSITYYMLERSEFLILKYEPLVKSGNWIERNKYLSEEDTFSLMFAAIARMGRRRWKLLLPGHFWEYPLSLTQMVIQ